MAKARIAILISGRGSNMQALIDAARDPDYPAEIALVISNRPKAPGLAKAGEAGISARSLITRISKIERTSKPRFTMR